jgi:glycosyltransferase involved in cell wall biosynthesis
MSSSPKCLHVVENLDRGAVENWLVRMLRHARETNVDVDWSFYCALGRPGQLDQQARELGAKVIHSPAPIGNKTSFVRALRSELQKGQYDVLHCHHDLVSAMYLLAAVGTPVQRRIVHVHNSDEGVLTPSNVKQRLYREPLRRICLAMADCVVGISDHTLDTFLAGKSRKKGRDMVHYYGVDPRAFQNLIVDRKEFRRQLGLPEDALLLLFAGRLVPEKNPVFVADVLAELRQLEPRVFALFAGTGSLAEDVLARVEERGLDSAIRMMSWRKDLPAVMSNCDWFILPHPEHPMEGFGIAVVEAQLAGLRLLISRGIANDPLLPNAVFRRLSLTDSPKQWAQAAMELILEEDPSAHDAINELKNSPMDMDRALSMLVDLHEHRSNGYAYSNGNYSHAR